MVPSSPNFEPASIVEQVRYLEDWRTEELKKKKFFSIFRLQFELLKSNGFTILSQYSLHATRMLVSNYAQNSAALNPVSTIPAQML